MKKVLTITALLFAMLPLLLVGGPASAQEGAPTDPGAVYRAAIAALSAGDIDTYASFFADDVVSTALPPPPGEDAVDIGIEALRTVAEGLVARNIQIEFTTFHVQGESVSFTAAVVEDFFIELGVAPIHFSGVAIVQDGLIQTETWLMSKDSLSRLEAAIALQANKASLHRAYEEVFNGKNLDLLDEQIAPDAIDHSFPDLSGVDAFKLPIGGLLAAFPDLQVTPNFIVAEGDMVMALATFTGTHQGEFLGVQPTGKQITWSHVDINRIEDGKVVEAWHIGSPEAILQALGFEFVPPAE